MNPNHEEYFHQLRDMVGETLMCARRGRMSKEELTQRLCDALTDADPPITDSWVYMVEEEGLALDFPTFVTWCEILQRPIGQILKVALILRQAYDRHPEDLMQEIIEETDYLDWKEAQEEE